MMGWPNRAAAWPWAPRRGRAMGLDRDPWPAIPAWALGPADGGRGSSAARAGPRMAAPAPIGPRGWGGAPARLCAVAVLAMALLAPEAGAQEAPPEPEGYRMEAYRAPVPETLAGARVLSTEEARALWEEGGAAVFVDVLPRAPRPEGLAEGTLWRPPPREDIPGSVWLPDTGFGALSPEAADYLARGLRGASGGDPAALLVFYCKAECWMSWNAAKRAMEEMGHEAVAWYPDGTDGWAAAGLPLEPREPEAPDG